MVAGYARPTAVLGGAVLLGLAWKSWRETPARHAPTTAERNLLGNTATTFVLTLSNPMTILSFAAMVASVGADAPAFFVTGVFLGSMLWWTVLSTAADWMGASFDIRRVAFNRFSALTLASFGIWAIWAKGLR